MIKKIIILLLLLSSFIYATDTLKFHVKAELIDPLVLKSLDDDNILDFGSLRENQRNKKTMDFEIKGSENQKYSLVINNGNPIVNLISQRNKNKKIPVYLDIIGKKNGSLTAGKDIFTLVALADSTNVKNLPVGKYDGKITLRVNYD
ncbi:hypothetical protein [Cetobacterium ceti]